MPGSNRQRLEPETGAVRGRRGDVDEEVTMGMVRATMTMIAVMMMMNAMMVMARMTVMVKAVVVSGGSFTIPVSIVTIIIIYGDHEQECIEI